MYVVRIGDRGSSNGESGHPWDHRKTEQTIERERRRARANSAFKFKYFVFVCSVHNPCTLVNSHDIHYRIARAITIETKKSSSIPDCPSLQLLESAKASQFTFCRPSFPLATFLLSSFHSSLYTNLLFRYSYSVVFLFLFLHFPSITFYEVIHKIFYLSFPPFFSSY